MGALPGDWPCWALSAALFLKELSRAELASGQGQLLRHHGGGGIGGMPPHHPGGFHLLITPAVLAPAT